MRIRQAAFECLVAISSTHYEKLDKYIQSIFNITSKAVMLDEEHVAVQAIMFWSSVYGVALTAGSEAPCVSFIKPPLPNLVPLLLETLLKKEKDQDQDEGAWNLAMEVGTCLGLVARTLGDDIVALVTPFIEANIIGPGSEAATYALGSIMEGPSTDNLTPIVKFALNTMLDALTTDPNSHVKDTTAWTIGRIFEFIGGSTVAAHIITTANSEKIIRALLQSVNDAQNVSEIACRALYFLALGYEDVVTNYFWDIVKSLLRVTDREVAGESQLRTAACETLIQVVRCSTDELAFDVLDLLPYVLTKLLQHTVEAQKLSSDKRERQNELQDLLCGCLLVIIQKLGGSESVKYQLMQYVYLIMKSVLCVIDCRSATVHEKEMLTIGALVTAITPVSDYEFCPDFSKFLPVLLKYLEMGLQNVEEYHVCAVTVGVVGDICRLVGDKIRPYSDRIMTDLLTDLNITQLHRSVKPPIFSCFGDIALAIRENFENYLEDAMFMLQSAADEYVLGRTSGADDEMIEYTNLLRNGILKAYSGILQGFKNTPKTHLLNPYAMQILQFIHWIYDKKDMDDVVLKIAIEVLGNLADTFVGVSVMHGNSWCMKILHEGLSSCDHLIRESAECAKLPISHAVDGCDPTTKRMKHGSWLLVVFPPQRE